MLILWVFVCEAYSNVFYANINFLIRTGKYHRNQKVFFSFQLIFKFGIFFTMRALKGSLWLCTARKNVFKTSIKFYMRNNCHLCRFHNDWKHFYDFFVSASMQVLFWFFFFFKLKSLLICHLIFWPLLETPRIFSRLRDVNVLNISYTYTLKI